MATLRFSALIGFAAIVCAVLFAPAAQARTFPDVAKSYWDYAAINWVTNQGPAGAKLLDDYVGMRFAPDQPISREQLAAALVTSLGRQGESVPSPVALTDLPASDPYFHVVQVALALHFFEASKGKFDPVAGVTESQADHALVRMIYLLHPHNDWSMLRALAPGTWQPNPGWKTGAPSRLPWEVAARFLGLRFNHLSAPALEFSPDQDIDRAEAAYMFKAALTVAPWQLEELSWFDQVSLPSLSARQRQIIAFALQYVGYPYVWGGTYPTPDSPYGLQAHGGFDCSGFVWWVLKTNFGYAIPNAQRTAAQMAAAAKPRIPMAKLAPCDIIFFGPKGPKSSAASVFHTAIYLGNGWFIESSNFFDGVTLANLKWPGWYYASAFAWGRQVLSPAQLGTVAGT
jgi:cell wall-associated NlpC family hydrolase